MTRTPTSYEIAFVDAAMIASLTGKAQEPFWQQAYANLIRWIRTAADLAGAAEPDLHRIAALARNEQQLKELIDSAAASPPARKKRRAEAAQLRRWHREDWSRVHPKLRNGIGDGLERVARSNLVVWRHDGAAADAGRHVRIGQRRGPWDDWDIRRLPIETQTAIEIAKLAAADPARPGGAAEPRDTGGAAEPRDTGVAAEPRDTGGPNGSTPIGKTSRRTRARNAGTDPGGGEGRHSPMLERKFPSVSSNGDELRLELAPKVSLLTSIAEMIEAFGEANAIPDQQVFLVNLEVDELITNYVRHSLRKVAYPRVELTLRVEPQKLIIVILDTGPPFNPLAAPEPDLTDDIDKRQIGGLGLHLVRSYCDRMNYEQVDGFNRLTLEHDLQPHDNAGAGPLAEDHSAGANPRAAVEEASR